MDFSPSPAYYQHPYNSEKYTAGIGDYEYIWIEHQPILAERGYMLRPRYRLDWVPSWLGKGDDHGWMSAEDGEPLEYVYIMDAIRVADGKVVAIKMVDKTYHPNETAITKLFSTEPVASHPFNHTVPLYDAFPSPLYDKYEFLVLPYLVLPRDVRFATIGETVGFFDELFEGLQLIHQQCVAHRDIGKMNIMMDGSTLLSDPPHPSYSNRSYDYKRKLRRYTRTQHPPRYYFIDFGLSRLYSPEETSPEEYPVLGGDKTVPEFRDMSKPHNPFWTDIYYLGNFIREDFLERCYGLDFMEPLIRDMVQDDPARRPSIEEARARYLKIRSSLSWWKLRSRLVYRKDWSIPGSYRACRHVFRMVEYMLTRKPAIPVP